MPSASPATLHAATTMTRLTLCLIALGIAAASCDAPPPSRRAASRQDALMIEEHFKRYATEALLVPLLDSVDARHFTRADPRRACGAGTEVRIDGRPLSAGRSIPVAPFTVQWMMVECHPFGGTYPLYSGNVKLTVLPEAGGYSVRVQPLGLRISTLEGAVRMWSPFAAPALSENLFSAVP